MAQWKIFAIYLVVDGALFLSACAVPARRACALAIEYL